MINLFCDSVQEKFELRATDVIARDSLDYQHEGASEVGRTNKRFNRKLYALYPNGFRLLDLGCGDGVFVEDCVRDGYAAVGLDGSDFFKRSKLSAWGRIPDNLFTCDVTKPLSFNYKFDVITLWEVIEHIPEWGLGVLFQNLKLNLAENGIVIASTQTHALYAKDGTDLHVTKRPKKWWVGKFAENGFVYNNKLMHYFNSQWVSTKFETPTSFHMVFGGQSLSAPKLGPLKYLADNLIGIPYRGYMHGVKVIIRDTLHPPPK